MSYQWNPLWTELEDPEIGADYLASIRRGVMAAINWAAEHPDANPQWQELDREKFLRNHGIPTTARNTAFIGEWQMAYRPANDDARAWFAAIDAACKALDPDRGASVHMMDKAIGCAKFFLRYGWDEFDTFMLIPRKEEKPQ